MTVDQVCAHFSTKISAVLRAQEVDGSVLSTVTGTALEKVGFTVLQADRVIQKRDELLAAQKGNEKGNDTDDPGDHSDQEPRKFLQVISFCAGYAIK